MRAFCFIYGITLVTLGIWGAGVHAGGLEGLEQFEGERGLVAEDVCHEQHQALVGDIPMAALGEARVLSLEHIDEAEGLAVAKETVDAENAFVPL